MDDETYDIAAMISNYLVIIFYMIKFVLDYKIVYILLSRQYTYIVTLLRFRVSIVAAVKQ